MPRVIPHEGTDLERFMEIVKNNYVDQAIWFLNACWQKLSDKEKETIWRWSKLFKEFDTEKGADMLEDFPCHRFYERIKSVHTVRELRDKIKEIGWQPKKIMYPMMIVLFLEFPHAADWQAVVRADKAQGGGESEALRKARAALAEVQKIIDEIETEKKRLEELSNGTGIKAMKAKNELAQLLASDPLPLRKALITAEAAVRKAIKMGGEGGENAISAGDQYFMEMDLDEMKKYKPSSKQ